jgi:predicted nucleic acid-binding protein
MRLALDTNRYIDLCRDVDGVAETLEEAEAILLPFPVLAELRAGFAVGSHGPENERTLRRFLMQPGVSALFADEQTTHQYASLFRQLRSQGSITCRSWSWCKRERGVRRFGRIGPRHCLPVLSPPDPGP